MVISSIVRRLRTHFHVALPAAGLVCLALALGCKPSILAPAQSTITLTPGNTVIATGGSTTITALVLEQSGSPVVDSTAINFQTTLGTLQPGQARTKNGQATTQLLAGTQSGTASVTATSGSVKSAAVTITIGSPLGVTITAQPTVAPVNTIVSFTATITPATGAPAIQQFAWDFGDQKTATTSSGSTSHVYTTAGTMIVKVTATAVDGSQAVGQIEIIVQ